MRRLIFVAVVLASGVAHADEHEPQSMFGLRITLGALPLAPQQQVMIGELGLSVEHPLCGKLRAFGEYGFQYLSTGDDKTSHDIGTGHAVRIGLRRALAATTWKRSMRFYIDGEVGGGVALTDDTINGARVLPHALAGLRFGYDLFLERKQTFEAELLIRAIAIDRGAGFTFGVGMAWGS